MTRRRLKHSGQQQSPQQNTAGCAQPVAPAACFQAGTRLLRHGARSSRRCSSMECEESFTESLGGNTYTSRDKRSETAQRIGTLMRHDTASRGVVGEGVLGGPQKSQTAVLRIKFVLCMNLFEVMISVLSKPTFQKVGLCNCQSLGVAAQCKCSDF